MLDRVFVEGGEDDPGLTVQFAAGQDDPVHRVGDEFLRYGERVGEDLHPVLAEVLRHEPGSGACIQDDGIAIPTQVGGPLGNGALEIGVQSLAGVEAGRGQRRLAGGDGFRPAVDAPKLAGVFKLRKVAAQGGDRSAGHTHKVGASVATLRRDLAKLEDSGQLRRVHGGAESVASGQTPLTAPSFDASQTLNADLKRAVAQGAANLCQDGDSIILNAGSTTWFMAQYLRQHRMQVLTNSFPIAQELIGHSMNRVVLPGGELYREAGIILSPFDEDAIQHFAASKMFMSCYSITPLGII